MHDHHHDDLTASRRRLLLTSGILASGAVGGCLSNDGDESTPAADTDEPADTDASTATAAIEDPLTFDGGGARAFQAGLDALQENPGETLTVEPGTYEIDDAAADPDVGFHFVVEGLEDVTIDGEGAEFVFQDPTIGFLGCFDSDDVTIRGLTLDWDPLPFTQGTIESLSDDKRTIELALDEGYPAPDAPHFEEAVGTWGTLHDPETGRRLSGWYSENDPVKAIEGFERIGDRRFEVQINEGSLTRGFEEGLKMTAVARPRGTAGFDISNCRSPVVEGVTMYTSPLAAIKFRHTEAARVTDFTVASPEDSDRLMTTVSDGIRTTTCPTGTTIEDSHLELLQDDPVVFDARINPVEEILEPTVVKIGKVALTQIQPGEDLVVMSPQGERKGSLPEVTNVTIGFSSLKDPARPEQLTFAEPVDELLEPGDFVVNLDRSNADFVLRNTDVVDTRARSVRVTSGPGTIEGCTLDGSGAGGIYLEQFSFGDSYGAKRWVSGLEIRDNDILNGGLSGGEWGNPPKAAGIWTKSKPDEKPPGRPHNDIAIENNRIETCSRKPLQIADATDVTVANNELVDPNQLDLPENDLGVYVENAENVEVRGNTLRGSADDVETFGRAESLDMVTAADNTAIVDGEEREGTFEEARQAWRSSRLGR